MALSKGTKAPDFSLPSTDGTQFKLSDHHNEPLLIYFYPLDFTPGCAKEACSFRDNFEFFKNADIKVYGISTDSIEKHLKFKEKHKLPFDLLSDQSKKVSKLYDAVIPFVGISKRVTYLLDANHTIVGVYDNLFGYEKHIEEMIKQVNKNS